MPTGELPDVLHGLPDAVPEALAAVLREVRLVDHHVHGSFTAAVTRGELEEALNEGSTDPVPAFMTQFDSPLGFAVRRWCAPVLGLEAHAGADAYWAARSALGVEDLSRSFLTRAGVGRWVVDTGFSSGRIATPDAMTALTGVASSEVLRLEVLLEAVADGGTDAARFAGEFRARLAAAAPGVVGVKSIAAYRCGFDIDWSRPSEGAVAAAAAELMARGAPARVTSPVLVAFAVHEAAALGLPLQLHVGFGDRDLDLHRTNPMLLLGLLRDPGVARVPVLLLHCYPYHREAAYLAQAFDHAHFDVGLAVIHSGASATAVVAEAMEIAPFAKQLYSSDAFGPPELHLLGSVLWRRAMGVVLGRWVREGDWSAADAVRVVSMVGRENAERVYGLPPCA